MSGKKILIISMVLLLALLGFVLGQIAVAAVDGPGSQADPLVTKSYIDAEVAKLQAQIDNLAAEVEKLKAK